VRTGKNETIVVSELNARSKLGKLLRRVEDERRSLIIEKRGAPKAVLLTIRDYARLAAPEPEVFRAAVTSHVATLPTRSTLARSTESSKPPARKNRRVDNPAPPYHRYEFSSQPP